MAYPGGSDFSVCPVLPAAIVGASAISSCDVMPSNDDDSSGESYLISTSVESAL